MRETGHYWVKLDNAWEVAFWDGDGWFIIFGNNHYPDRHFQEIDEKQIKRE